LRENNSITNRLTEILNKYSENEILSYEDSLFILDLPDRELPKLFEVVYTTRKRYKGNVVNINILTNVRSGDCSENCIYCSQSYISETNVNRYKLVAFEKLLKNNYVVEEKKLARHCIGVSGIRFDDCEIDNFANYIIKLKKEINTSICCSIGFLTPTQAKKLKSAGVDRINHNLNTSRNHYKNICTTHTYDDRIENIKMFKNIGFEICCGGIVGIGESKEDVVDMLFSIKDINPNAIPINFLVPISGTTITKTKKHQYLSSEYCLKVLAITRLLNPKSEIRCAAGRETYLKGKEELMFYAVDSIFAQGYLTVDGQTLDDTIKTITDLGFQYCIE